MPDNTHRFTGRAQDYDRYRQRYPTDEILTQLRAWCGLAPQWLIADIGAGTGMLAEVFLANGNRVLAIEPNSDMRQQMRDLFPQSMQLEILDATAEITTLPNASVDMVAAGRAFHWFDTHRALAEFRRILKPGGWVTLVAIDRAREEADPLYRDQIAAYESLMETHSPDYVRVRSGFRAYYKMDTLFDGEIHQLQLPGVRLLDWPTFRGHTMSLSVAPGPEHPNNAAFLRDLRRYFDTFAHAGVYTMPTTCWITAANFRMQSLPAFGISSRL